MMHLDGRYFKDETGRILVLRGVNLGGSSKVPRTPDGATWRREGFYDHRTVSFVGRPFPIQEADEHFERLRAWGFTFLRFLITWEAIEHAGPGVYDQAYLDYLYQVIRKAAEYGMEVLIDPHQDTWSRFTGGDGAPGWTLEAVGMDLTRLHAAGAAILHQEHGDPFPRMVWPTNNDKLAAATLFTLFFGGDDFAPHLEVEGIPVQEYLQGHYFNAVRQVAERLKDLPNVVGYDTLNEPSAGYIGVRDAAGRTKSILRKGECPTVFQAMLAASGYPQKVDVYDVGLRGIYKVGARVINPAGLSIWREGCADIWQSQRVWGLDSAGQPQLLRPDYFGRVGAREVDFTRDYYKPFANRFAREIRAVDPRAIIFVESVPAVAELTWDGSDAVGVVHAPHWYDGFTLTTKTFRDWITIDGRNIRLVLGRKQVQQCFVDQIAQFIRQSDEEMDHAPTLIGEVGIPFDLQGKRAYRSGDFSLQVKALDATMQALEKNFVGFTLWNYTPDNTNAHGDQWNDEDLSLFSRDQMSGSSTLYDGGRALQAAIRPYPRKIAGRPLRMAFDLRSAAFEFVFEHFANVSAPTEIFVPAYHYPKGCRVEVSDGDYEFDPAAQLLRYCHTSNYSLHTLRIFRQK